MRTALGIPHCAGCVVGEQNMSENSVNWHNDFVAFCPLLRYSLCPDDFNAVTVVVNPSILKHLSAYVYNPHLFLIWCLVLFFFYVLYIFNKNDWKQKKLTFGFKQNLIKCCFVKLQDENGIEFF